MLSVSMFSKNTFHVHYAVTCQLVMWVIHNGPRVQSSCLVHRLKVCSCSLTCERTGSGFRKLTSGMFCVRPTVTRRPRRSLKKQHSRGGASCRVLTQETWNPENDDGTRVDVKTFGGGDRTASVHPVGVASD